MRPARYSGKFETPLKTSVSSVGPMAPKSRFRSLSTLLFLKKNIAERIGKYLRVPYLAGLWEADLMEDLCWYVNLRGTPVQATKLKEA